MNREPHRQLNVRDQLTEEQASSSLSRMSQIIINVIRPCSLAYRDTHTTKVNKPFHYPHTDSQLSASPSVRALSPFGDLHSN